MSGFDHDDQRLLENLLVQLGELRSELRHLRNHPVIARLSDAEREQIAYRVIEHLDERLAPRELAAEPAPRSFR